MPETPIWFSSSDRECAGINLDIMYPDKDDKRGLAIAKSICADCVFIDPCRDYAMKNHETGVWGGTDDRDRRTIQREATKYRRSHGNAS